MTNIDDIYTTIKYFYKLKKLFSIVNNTIILQPFYREFPDSKHEDAMRFLDIIQAGGAIEKHYNFSIYDSIPWNSFSKVESTIYKAYYSYFYKDYSAGFDKGKPPELSRHILFLERQYDIKIIK